MACIVPNHVSLFFNKSTQNESKYDLVMFLLVFAVNGGREFLVIWSGGLASVGFCWPVWVQTTVSQVGFKSFQDAYKRAKMA